MATNDFIINITGEINETETRRRIQEALSRIVPNATINIQTTGTTQAVNDIDNVSKAIGTTAALSVEAVRQIENVVKKLIDTTEQLDKSLTNIRIVMHLFLFRILSRKRAALISQITASRLTALQAR